jgi:uncharacterized protein with PhoU and TrkA domain
MLSRFRAIASPKFHGLLSQPGRRHSSQLAVDLSYTSIIPDNGNANENVLVVLHGLLFV